MTIPDSGARQDALSAHWRAREEARLRVARLRIADEASLERALQRSLTIGAAVLQTERVGVWLIDEARNVLASAQLLDQGRVGPEDVALPIGDIAVYSSVLHERRVLPVPDVRTEPLTLELLAGYFEPRGLRATLEAPLYRNGKVMGVICFEHRGAPRNWTALDADFAISMADMISLMYASLELGEATSALVDAEEQLHEIQTADAMSRFARGVAHDINNVLGVILLAVGSLERRAQDPESTRTASLNIAEAAESAGRLARQLLALGREPEISPQERRTPIDETLGLIESTLRGLAGEARTFTLTCGAPGAMVRIDATQFEQILLNLVVNARDATKAQGRIEVTSRRAQVRKAGRVSEMVVVEVRDDGTGMNDATRARIFEPFFSTKGSAGNRGLGLATSQSIVREAGGTIQVESSPGLGSLFRVVLPVVPA